MWRDTHFLHALITSSTVQNSTVRGSKAFIRISVSVYPHNRTKTTETTITKLAKWIVHHESWPPI